MIALRYKVRDKIQSEKKFSLINNPRNGFIVEKNCLKFPVRKVSCLEQIHAYHH